MNTHFECLSSTPVNRIPNWGTKSFFCGSIDSYFDVWIDQDIYGDYVLIGLVFGDDWTTSNINDEYLYASFDSLLTPNKSVWSKVRKLALIKLANENLLSEAQWAYYRR